MILVTASADVANTTYLWVYIVIGIVGFFATAIAVAKWLRKQGAEDERGANRDNALERRLAAIEKKLTPNGLDTNQLGDVTRRTELKVDQIASKLDQHIGAEEQARSELWREVHRKQDKERTRP